MSVENYFLHYKKSGFNFSNKVLTRYCLSLYTKPFVLLSGISGTGKTKIAQLFEEFVDDEVTNKVNKIPDPEFDYIIMNLTNGVLYKDGRGNFKYNKLSSIFEADEISEIEQDIAQSKQAGGGGNIGKQRDFDVETEFGEIKLSLYFQRAGSPLLRVRTISKKDAEIKYNTQEILKQKFKENDTLELVKIGKRRLKLMSINKKEVLEVKEIIEKKELSTVNNKHFLSVKSNWSDSTEIFGYYNILQEKYIVTPVLRFLLLALDYPMVPFFLVLDEMNLSRVEHYFSDFLSCLESRIEIDGEIKQESIQLHNNSTRIERNDNNFDEIPESIIIPLNLYVTGTVNIDETTFTFSPKVLDRANVIEFNTVNLDIYDGSPDENKFTLNKFPKFARPELPTSYAYLKSPEIFKRHIREILLILEPHNLHFGYRVINEMALFINNAIFYIASDESVIIEALDVQIIQKILPKLSGSFGKLDEPIRKLICYFIFLSQNEIEQVNFEFIRLINSENSKFTESILKLKRMYINLTYNGFASFLE